MSSPATASDGGGSVAQLAAELQDSAAPIRDVVVIVEPDQCAFSAELAARLGEANILVLLAAASPLPSPDARVSYAIATSVRQRIDALKGRRRPQVVVDASTADSEQRCENLEELYFLLDEGGCYIADRLGSCAGLIELIAEVATTRWMADAATATNSESVLELANATDRVVFRGDYAVLRKTGRHLYKLREHEADEVLGQRYGDAWGETLMVRPERTVTSQARVTSHGDGPITSQERTFTVPELRLRRYRNAVCAALQVAVHEDYVLPDTWRHPHQEILTHRHLINSSTYLARLKPGTAAIQLRELAGTYFLFDSEHPRHYGHITTEVLSRVWGWQQAVRLEPAIRPLFSDRNRRADLPDFQREIFEALRIPLDEAVVIYPRDVVRVENLVAATPQFENPFYIDPDLRTIWRELGAGVPRSSTAVARPRIFVSRKPGTKRFCQQTTQVEEFFARHGFHVFYPEDLPFAEQARLFAGAEIVAGFGGSGMFTMMLAPAAQIILISGNGYNAENEHLIAAVNGNRLDYFWGRSTKQTSAGYTQLEAARSDFSFDLRRHRRALLKTIG